MNRSQLLRSSARTFTDELSFSILPDESFSASPPEAAPAAALLALSVFSLMNRSQLPPAWLTDAAPGALSVFSLMNRSQLRANRFDC